MSLSNNPSGRKFLLQLPVWLICFLLLLSTAGCSRKAAEPEIPARDGWVTDLASILPEPDRRRLAVSLETYEKETCHQVYVLVVPTTANESIEVFSQRVATGWDIGHEGFGNGILLTIAVQDGNVRMETDSAFEWMINDGTADRILKQTMFPYFREDRFIEGIEQGLEEIMQAARLKVVSADHRPDICR